MEGAAPLIVFGVPVYRRYDLLDVLLRSLFASTLLPDRIVIVDNGGHFNSHIKVAVNLPPVQIVAPGHNTGCSGAWNLILDHTDPGDLVIISNDDMVLAPESIQIMVDAASQADLVQGFGFSLFSVSRQLVDEVGFFDENFHPIYFEDLDFHHRVRLRGKRHTHVDAHATHAHSATMATLNPAERKAFGLRQSVLKSYYARKWGGVPTKGQPERYETPFNGNVPKGWKLRPVTRP